VSFAKTYANWVLDPSNTQKTGQYIKLAAKRFLDDLQRTDIRFDEAQGNAMIDFVEGNLYHWEDKWRGTPVVLEPWQKFIFQQIYGWIVVETGLRRVRMAFIEIAKKNAKTAMCAYMALYHLFDDRINSPKIFVGANNHEQANICTNYAGKTIEISPNLYDYVEDETVKLSKYNGNIFKVIHNDRDGFIETMPKEPADPESKQAGGKHGKSPSLVIIDEYGLADSDSLLNAMENAQGAREEPMTAAITTASHKKQGPCFTKMRDTGIKVLEGVLTDDSFLVFIYEMDKPRGEDGKPGEITVDYLINNPDLWQQSNPNHKISVFDAFLKSQLTKAKNEGGTKEIDVLTFNFNLWVDSPDVFISADIWNKNEHGLTIEDGEICYGGIEIGPSGHPTCVALLFPGEIPRIKMMFIISETGLQANDFYKDNKKYFYIDAGNEVEVSVAKDWIMNEWDKYQVHSFCFWRKHQNVSLIQELIKAGYEGNPIAHQGSKDLVSATDEWEKELRNGKVEHFGNPVLRWMNSNCLALRKSSGIQIEKSNNVLGILACLNAWSQWKTISANEIIVGTEVTAL
jgi:phage terminase large subunit-like protein